jgi:DNA polymerase-1
MELRAVASYINEPTLLSLFAEGIDPHRKTAAAIFNKPEEEVTAEERGIGKTCNLTLI